MAPPCPLFDVADLSSHVQLDAHGRRRKPDPDSTAPARKIDLSTCELLSMMQYACKVSDPKNPQSKILCYPVERKFRQCKDQKGTFMVETTSWENLKERQELVSDAAI